VGHKFTGKERDSESGLDNFGARYDSSSLGRFLSPDWSESPDAVPYADLTNPQTLNLYGYVTNNPLSRADANGHCPSCLIYVEELATSPEGQAILDNTVGIVVAGAAAGYAAGKGWFDKAADFIFSGAAPTPGAGSEMPGPLLGEKPLLTENVSEKPNSSEPPQLAEGKQAHRDEPVREGEKPEVTTPSGTGRMDRYDSDKAHIREIKPNNPRGTRSGRRQLDRYKKEMDQATGKDHSTELTLNDKDKKIIPREKPE
jgi:RHS repeat-associated protein